MSATDTRAVVQQMVKALDDASWNLDTARATINIVSIVDEALAVGRALLAALPEQPAAPQGDSVAGSGLPLDTVRTGLEAERCWCHTCRPITLSDMRMVLCPQCGNKRCPKANFHGNPCTNSNALGQPGSAYPGPATSLGAVSVPDETCPGWHPGGATCSKQGCMPGPIKEAP